MPGRSGGWTPAGMGSGRSRCGARSSVVTTRRCTRAPGSSPAASRTPRSTRPTAFVRVNQVGYPAASAKRAFLMASDVVTGATFSVSAGGSAAFSGSVGADLGAWSAAYPHVYALDFTSFSTAGTYSIDVAGPIPASSPAFRIGTGSALYSQALTNARSFFGNERDGAGYIPSALRTAPGHLNDQNAMTYSTPSYNAGSGRFSGDLSPLGVRVDASGGWWDAGDYLKFLQTESYTDGVLLSGVRDFPSQMASSSTGADFTAEAKFGAQFLLRMWDDPSRTLYYQVGIGEGNGKTAGDHDIWRLPQADDTFGGTDPVDRYIRNRPVFRAGAPGSLISPNLAGRDAAALAECYVVFKTSDPTLAGQCITAAEHIFALANTAPTGNLQTVIPFSFSPETEWRDDLEWGATELDFAVAAGGAASTGHQSASYYLDQAAP